MNLIKLIPNMHIFNMFYLGALYQKSKLSRILNLDYVKNNKNHLNFVLILSLAT